MNDRYTELRLTLWCDGVFGVAQLLQVLNLRYVVINAGADLIGRALDRPEVSHLPKDRGLAGFHKLIFDPAALWQLRRFTEFLAKMPSRAIFDIGDSSR